MSYCKIVAIIFVVIFCNSVHILGEYQSKLPDSEEVHSQHRYPRSAPETDSEDVGDFFKEYHRMRKINSFVNSLAKKNPSGATVVSIGKTFEGRDMKVIKIGTHSLKAKQAIWIDGGIHAREWISPPTALYIAKQLLLPCSKDLLKDFHWYILPVLNPDGYEYSHTKDRRWRKNRSKSTGRCVGVDLNRNFDFHWNGRGASNKPCSETYAGTRAFSEPETIAMSNFILKEKKKHPFLAYLTLHSYGQHWLTPWGYTHRRPRDYEEMAAVAKKAVKALAEVNGTKYTISTSTEVVGLAAGGSDDWAKGSAGIKYSYTVELPDTGKYGFLLPKERIPGVVKETWEAVKAFAAALRDQTKKKKNTLLIL